MAKPNRPEGQHTPVFTRGTWKKCTGFTGHKCFDEFLGTYKKTMCDNCVKLKYSWGIKGSIDNS